MENISFYSSCSTPPTQNGPAKYTGLRDLVNSTQTEMLILSQKYLKKHKDYYGINKIVLQDNSMLEKPHCKKKIKTSIHYFVLNEDTWCIFSKLNTHPHFTMRVR